MNQYDVIYLNMQRFLIRAKDHKVTEYLERAVIEELRDIYGDLFPERVTVLAEALENIYVKTDKQFIFLIDEWDCVIRERQESEALQKQYLDFLRDLLKDQPYVALAYVTGILPVKKYGLHSALNMFWEYSMTDQKDLEEYTGFTGDEVKALCRRYDMNFAETGSWYDGYRFTKITMKTHWDAQSALRTTVQEMIISLSGNFRPERGLRTWCFCRCRIPISLHSWWN